MRLPGKRLSAGVKRRAAVIGVLIAGLVVSMGLWGPVQHAAANSITAISPGSGSVLGGETLEITGSGFAAGSGFKKVDYLDFFKSTTTNYYPFINTGIKHTADTVVVVKYMMTVGVAQEIWRANGPQSTNSIRLFGAAPTTDYPTWSWQTYEFNGPSVYKDVWYIPQGATVPVTATTGNGWVKMDDRVGYSAPSTYTNGGEIYVGGLQSANFTGKIYSFIIKQGNTTVFEGWPAYGLSYNTVTGNWVNQYGLIDEISNKFVVNSVGPNNTIEGMIWGPSGVNGPPPVSSAQLSVEFSGINASGQTVTTPCGNLTIVDPTKATCIVPPSMRGGNGSGNATVTVKLTDAGGTTITNTFGYTYYAETSADPPTVTSITPNSGPLDGDTPVAVTGTGFVTELDHLIDDGNQVDTPANRVAAAWTVNGATVYGFWNQSTGALTQYQGLNTSGWYHGKVVQVPPTRVIFGGHHFAVNVTVTSPTAMTAVTSHHCGGVSDVVVEVDGLASEPLTNGFTFFDADAGISPTSGPVTGGNTLEITGSGFGLAGGAYTPVEYLQFHQDPNALHYPFIKTPIGFSKDKVVTTIYAITDEYEQDVWAAETSGFRVGLSSVGASSSVVDQIFRYNTQSAVAAIGSGSTEPPTVMVVTTGNDAVYFDRTLVLNYAGVNPPAPANMVVGGSQSGFFTGRIYTFHVINGVTSEVLFHGVPAYGLGYNEETKTSYNQYGLYDLVSKQFFVNSLGSNGKVAGLVAGPWGEDPPPAAASLEVTLTGGIPCGNLQIQSPTKATCTVPPSMLGGDGLGDATVQVKVTNTHGTTTTPYTYTYLAPKLTLTAITPDSGPIAGGTAVTLEGSGFVTWLDELLADAQTVTNWPIDSVPAAWTVDGQTVFGFVNETTGALTPHVGTNLSGKIDGQVVVVEPTRVVLGGVMATGVTVTSPFTMTATTSQRAKGTVDVTVEVDGHVVDQPLVAGFTYIDPSEPIDGISPKSGPVSGGNTLEITGSGFGLGGGAYTTVEYLQFYRAKNGNFFPFIETPINFKKEYLVTATYSIMDGGQQEVWSAVSGGYMEGLVSQAQTAQPLVVDQLYRLLSNSYLPIGYGRIDEPRTIMTVTTGNGQLFFGDTLKRTYTATDLPAPTPINAGGRRSGFFTGRIYDFKIVDSKNSQLLFHGVPSYGLGQNAQTGAWYDQYGLFDTVSGQFFVNSMNQHGWVEGEIGGPWGPGNIKPPASQTVTVSFTGNNSSGVPVTLPCANLQVLNSTSATCTVPPSMLPGDGAGKATVTVKVQDGQNIITKTYDYNYVPDPVTLTSITPDTGYEAGDTPVTLTGSGFVTLLDNLLDNGQVVSNWPTGKVPAAWTVNGATVYGFVDKSTGDLLVHQGSGTVTGVFHGKVTAIPPTRVLLDGIPATAVTVTSPTTMTAKTPPHIEGTVDVAVEVNGEMVGKPLAGGFTYTEDLSGGGISPKSGPVAGGQTLTIKGSGFTASSQPTNYEPVECIQFGRTTGSANINTGVAHHYNTEVTVTYSTGSIAGPQTIWGATTVARLYSEATTMDQRYNPGQAGSYYVGTPGSTAEVVTVKAGNGHIQWNDSPPTNHQLVGVTGNVTVGGVSDGRFVGCIYRITIEEAGVIKYDGLPVFSHSDNAYGLQNQVGTMQFYTFTNTATAWITGPGASDFTPPPPPTMLEVNFKGTDASGQPYSASCTNVQIIDDTTATCTVPPSQLGGSGAGTVAVEVKVGGAVPSTNMYSYTYIVETLALTSIAPDKGPMGGGALVTLTGTKFVTYLDGIKHDGVPISPAQGTRLAAWTSNGVTVYGAVDESTGALTPFSGSGEIVGVIGGQEVSIPPTTVKFDQTNALAVTVTSVTTMLAITPARDPATFDVSVVLNGTSMSLPNAYTFLPVGALVITKQAVVCAPGSPEINADYCAPLAAGQYVAAGTEVTWQYMVKHVVIGLNGQPILEPLTGMTDVTVVDDQLGAVCVIESLPINVGKQCFASDVLGVRK